MTATHPIARRRGRMAARAGTPAGFRRLAFLTFGLLWAVIPSGAAVRLTGSGLGCPDWPHCEDTIVPAADGHAWIEFTNRLFSGGVIVLCLATWIVARRLAGRPRTLRRPAFLAAAASVGQVPLGAVTVEVDLHPLAVGSHFLLSIVALTAGAITALRAHDHARGLSRRADRAMVPAALLAAAALGAVLVSGVLVTASGPHSGDRNVLDRVWNLDDAAFVHVRVVIAFGVAAALLAAVAWRRSRSGWRMDVATRRIAIATVLLFALQVTLGEIQYRNRLPWEVILGHVSVAGLLWATTTVLVWRLASRIEGTSPDDDAAARPHDPGQAMAAERAAVAE